VRVQVLVPGRVIAAVRIVESVRVGRLRSFAGTVDAANITRHRNSRILLWLRAWAGLPL
jgi:hypothetical protein